MESPKIPILETEDKMFFYEFKDKFPKYQFVMKWPKFPNLETAENFVVLTAAKCV